MKKREFTCDHCKETYEAGWSQEEAAAEEKEAFGFNATDEDRVVLCTDCYKLAMKAIHEHTPSNPPS